MRLVGALMEPPLQLLRVVQAVIHLIGLLVVKILKQVGLTAGSYTVIVTDANTCSVSENAVVSSSGGPAGTTSSTDATCNNPNGSASITVTGGTPGYNFSWSSGGTSASETGLVGGNYFVTVSDAGGCDLVTNILVNDNGVPNVSLNISDETCGNGNGSATVTASAGNGI